MVLTLQRFTKYQQAFLSKVLESPATAQIITTQVTLSSDSLDSFIGNSGRSESTKTFNVLYEYDIMALERDKPGIVNMHTGTVYLSPLQLIPIYGTYAIELKTTKVLFNNVLFLIDSVDYKENLFSSCIAVELRLKDYIRG